MHGNVQKQSSVKTIGSEPEPVEYNYQHVSDGIQKGPFFEELNLLRLVGFFGDFSAVLAEAIGINARRL